MSMKKLLLINSIVWAVVILIMAWLFKDHPNYIYGFGLLLMSATIMNSFILSVSKSRRKANCIK